MKLLRENILLLLKMYLIKKNLDKRKIALQEFILTDLERTKLASLIYGVSRSRGDGMGYYQKLVNPRTETLIKPSGISSSKSTQKGLDYYFVPD